MALLGGEKSNKSKNRKLKKSQVVKRALTLKEQNQEYARVESLCGDGRMMVNCMDGASRLGKVRGQMRKRVYVRVGDWVLVSLREIDQKKCDIILKYSEDECRQLKKQNEIKEFDEENNED